MHTLPRSLDLDVFILLQASPEQTKKQQEDADRAMRENHKKSEVGESGGSFATTAKLVITTVAGA